MAGESSVLPLPAGTVHSFLARTEHVAPNKTSKDRSGVMVKGVEVKGVEILISGSVTNRGRLCTWARLGTWARTHARA